MARLIKCKECGHSVSRTAKACPQCGAVMKRQRTSTFTWLVVIFFGLIVVLPMCAPETTAPAPAARDRPAQPQARATPRPAPQWRTSVSADEMTGETTYFAMSPQASPTQALEWPLHKLQAWLGAGCKKNSEWVFIGFTTAPNLTGDETKDGYNRLRTRVRWDTTVETVTLTQDWGSKFLHFQNDSAALARIAAGREVMVEVPWYGNGNVTFRFTLDGSSAALREMRERC